MYTLYALPLVGACAVHLETATLSLAGVHVCTMQHSGLCIPRQPQYANAKRHPHALTPFRSVSHQRHAMPQRCCRLPPACTGHDHDAVPPPPSRPPAAYRLRDEWSTPDAWRSQFWGQKDYTNHELQLLQTTQAERVDSSGNALSRFEFFASQPWIAGHNRQTKFMAGLAGNTSIITRKHLEKAKVNLAKIHVLGLVDDVPAYLNAFACHLNLASRGNRPVPRDNSGRHHGKSPPSAYLRALVYRNSWADYELIAFARKLIEEKKSACQRS